MLLIKQYFIGIAMILYAAAMLWNHTMDLNSAGEMVLGALAVMSVQGGVVTGVSMILSVLGVNVQPTANLAKLRKAVSYHVARRAAPVLVTGFMLFMAGGMLSACTTTGPGGWFDDPVKDLQLAEDGFATVQTLYNTVCAANGQATFCSAENMKTANDLADAVRGAIKSAQAVIANEGSTQAQIAAAIQGVTNAIQNFRDVVNDLSAKKAKALALKAGPVAMLGYELKLHLFGSAAFARG